LTARVGAALESRSFPFHDALMNSTRAARIAALAGFLAVALGAFGAHGLREVLARNETTAIWEKAVFYHFIHAVMLFVLAMRRPLPRGPWLSFLIGIALFSGSLYLLSVTHARWLGAVTPLGGIGFLVGWAWLLFCPDRILGGRTAGRTDGQSAAPE
jgi:uncharacterized membrane protein YgdD (TMEM256/DUF423 family)